MGMKALRGNRVHDEKQRHENNLTLSFLIVYIYYIILMMMMVIYIYIYIYIYIDYVAREGRERVEKQ